MFTFIEREDATLVILGHPPQGLIEQALGLPGLPEKLMLNQEEMHDAPKSYDIWLFDGEIKRFDITVSLADALGQLG